MVEQRIAAVLGRFDHARVLVRAERQAVRCRLIPARSSSSTAGATDARIVVGVLAERDRLVWRRFRDAGDRRRPSSRGTRRCSRRPRSDARPCRGLRGPRSGAPRSWSRSSPSETAKSARSSTSGSTRRCSAVTPSHGAAATAVVRPRLVAECSQPCGPAKSTSLRAASAASRRCLASSSSSSQPDSVTGASERSRWFIAKPPFRLPMPSEPDHRTPVRRRPRRLRSSPPRPPRRARRCRRAGRERRARSRARSAYAAAGTRGPC